jgi:hypothetical protein
LGAVTSACTTPRRAALRRRLARLRGSWLGRASRLWPWAESGLHTIDPLFIFLISFSIFKIPEISINF